jgi:hypothetical protein
MYASVYNAFVIHQKCKRGEEGLKFEYPTPKRPLKKQQGRELGRGEVFKA